MSLNPFRLKRLIKLGNTDAAKIYPIRKKGNLLLCTIHLGNVVVNAALSVFLGSLMYGVLAIGISSLLIVILGEIIPQAIFSRYALKLGGKTVWLVYLFIFLAYPIAKPLSMGLDFFLGKESPIIFSKREFRIFLHQQRKSNKSELDSDEFQILEGGLLFSERTVIDAMTPWKLTYALEASTVLTKQVIQKTHKIGHSRIPVYDQTKNMIVGILYAKDLMIFTEEKKKVSEVMRKVHFIRENERLDTALNLFRKRKMHIFMVQDKKGRTKGIITLEDILEEIVGEIVDEYDNRRLKDM